MAQRRKRWRQIKQQQHRGRRNYWHGTFNANRIRRRRRRLITRRRRHHRREIAARRGKAPTPAARLSAARPAFCAANAQRSALRQRRNSGGGIAHRRNGGRGNQRVTIGGGCAAKRWRGGEISSKMADGAAGVKSDIGVAMEQRNKACRITRRRGGGHGRRVAAAAASAKPACGSVLWLACGYRIICGGGAQRYQSSNIMA